jgi:hypothetical protein
MPGEGVGSLSWGNAECVCAPMRAYLSTHMGTCMFVDPRWQLLWGESLMG